MIIEFLFKITVKHSIPEYTSEEFDQLISDKLLKVDTADFKERPTSRSLAVLPMYRLKFLLVPV